MDGHDAGVNRRRFLQGASGFLASVTAVGEAVASEAPDGEEGPLQGVPRDARNVEAGLESFVAKWEALGPTITSVRFGRYLSGTTINCQVAGTPRAYTIELGPEGGATLTLGRSPNDHVTLVVDEQDWLDILYGEVSGLAPALAGRTFAEKSEVNYGSIFAIVAYVFAHLPASVGHDPEFNAETVEGIVGRGGQTTCGNSDSAAPPSVNVDEALGENRAPPATRRLAETFHDIGYEDVPDDVIAVAREQIKNVLSVSYAATELAPGRKLADAIETIGSGTEATAIAGDRTFRTSPEHAALLNASLAQLLEWEDFTYFAHTGSAIVPTALAAGELAGASGKEVLATIALANEVTGRTGFFLTDPTNLGQSLPVHETECPFIAGKLLGQDVETLQDASGIAGTQPHMTAIATWTGDSKGFIGGEPAAASLRAARLADEGLHGRRDHLENVAGYWYRVSDIPSPHDVSMAYDGVGEEWLLRDEYYNKRYPVNGFAQTAVHAARDIREQLLDAGIDPAEPGAIDEVRVRMNTSMAGTGTLFSEGSVDYIPEKVLNDERPDWTYIPLLYDAYYPIAAMLVEGELTHRQFTPEVVGDEQVLDVYRRTEGVTDISVGDYGAAVTVTTSEGQLESQFGIDGLDVTQSSYDAHVGCIRDGVNANFDGDDKFRKAASDTLSTRKIDRITDAIDDLESFTDINAFTRRL
ncbi:hypothetical protein BRC89_07630 [Halobacteriales archaeon QS_4_70_19]|nr:MAG: hypothetical protein BRC89_07630 [Halobacteriales archaeon QS_4_70_19]